jgi:hypothetical protein
VVTDAAGNLLIADSVNDCVREVNTATGIITTVADDGTCGYGGDGGQATAAELASPAGVAADAAGHIIIADTGNNCIRAVTLVHECGIVLVVAEADSPTPPHAHGLPSPIDDVFDFADPPKKATPADSTPAPTDTNSELPPLWQLTLATMLPKTAEEATNYAWSSSSGVTENLSR